jgi:hypothetical protein
MKKKTLKNGYRFSAKELLCFIENFPAPVELAAV